jgi:hypothetical protein
MVCSMARDLRAVSALLISVSAAFDRAGDIRRAIWERTSKLERREEDVPLPVKGEEVEEEGPERIELRDEVESEEVLDGELDGDSAGRIASRSWEDGAVNVS